MLTRTNLAIASLFAFLVGIGIAGVFPIPTKLVIVGGMLGVGLLFAGYKIRILLLTGLIILGCAMGLLRAELHRHITTPTTLNYWNDQLTPSNVPETFTITGIVSEDPDIRLDHTKLTLTAHTVTIHGHTTPTTGKLLVKTQQFPHYAYGDELRLTGNLQTPLEFPEFNYRNYLALQEIFSVMYYPRIEKTSSNHGNPFYAGLFTVRHVFEDHINRVFPEPHASFMAGLLTGSRRGIPEDVLADFNATGLTHIIAISGYNIALVIALAVALVGRFIRRSWQFPIVAGFVVLFTLFVGAGAPVVRAAITGLLAFFALTIGRQYHLTMALTLAASLMVAWNPDILLHDASFQLSFASVLGLVYLAPWGERLCAKLSNTLAIRDSLILTLAAQIATAPLIFLYFGRLAVIAPLANLLVAPAIPVAMATGLIATLVDFLSPTASTILGFVPYLVLSYILKVANVLAF